MSNYKGSSPTINDCSFSGNMAMASGGGMYTDSNSSPEINNCTFINNEAYYGAGMFTGSNSSPEINNCIFNVNTSYDQGGGMYNWDSSPTINNCTFSFNSANNDGGGMINNEGSSVTMTNCILWGNWAPTGPEISLYYSGNPSTLTISYSDVQGGPTTGVYVDPGCTLNWGAGMIDADPLFVSGTSGDYYLSQILAGQGVDSPCVDTGSDTAVNLGMDDKTTRTDNVTDSGIVDMGYHYEP